MEIPDLKDVAEVVAEAMTLEQEGQAELAFAVWNRLTVQWGSDSGRLVRIAEDLYGRNEAALSEALLSYLVRAHPDQPLAALKWMERALVRADWDEVRRRGVLALRRFPDASFGYVMTAQALRDSGNSEEADKLFAKAVELFPGDEGATVHWVSGAIRRSDWAEAGRRLQLARERFPNSLFGYSMGVEVLKSAGMAELAEALLCEAVERFPHDLQLHVDWTASASSRQDWPEAMRRGEISRARFPDKSDGILPIFHALTAMGRSEEAAALIKDTAEQFSHDPAILISWIQVAVKARDWVEAQARAGRLRELFPDHQAGYFFSALALREGGKPTEAVIVLEEGLRRFPADVSFLREASESLVELQRLDQAVIMLDRALQLQPRDPAFLQRRIQLSMSLGDHDGALATWTRLIADPGAGQKLCLDLAWTIFKASPADDRAIEPLRYLLNEKDSGARDWLPQLAGCVLLRPVRPDLLAFVKSALVRLEAGAVARTPLQVLKSALLEDYGEADIRGFIEDYVKGGRSAITAHLFSHTYTHEKPSAPDAFRAVFEPYIDAWLAGEAAAQFQNFTEILGYLNFAAIFSRSTYRRLIAACRLNLDIAALRRDDSLTNPASAVGRIVALASLGGEPLSPKSAVIGSIRRLKVAVCVSGQLRGYDRAFPTWERLGLGRHETRYFINTWQDIGRNWYRFWVFTQKRQLLWETLRRPDSTVVLAARYPTMTAACTGSSTVDAGKLEAFYGTPYVCVEDDSKPPFNDKSVPWKMHSKIERAHQMALNCGEEFDLYIRFRPDREVVEGSNPDWYAVLEQSKSERLIFSDRPLEYGLTKCSFGDQFAVGCKEVMDVYSTTFSATVDFLSRNEVPLDLPAALDNHGSMAYRTYYNGVLSSSVPNLTFGHLYDPVSLSPGDLVPLIENDISARSADEFDREFLDACRETVRQVA